MRLGATIYRLFQLCKKAQLGLIVAICLLVTPQVSFAGILGFKNETNMTLTIQEVKPGPLEQLAKAVKLIATETFSDTGSLGTTRRFKIYGDKNKLLFDGYVQSPSGKENITYSIKSDGNGGIKLEVVRPADDKKK